jgi:hypothetical protein
MNYGKVISRMMVSGLIRKRVQQRGTPRLTWRGTFRGNLVNLDHADILRYYSSIIRGIYNYYCFVNNMSLVARVVWLITESCAQTLARKYKMKSLKKVFHKFGKDLGINVVDSKGNNRRVSLYTPVDYKRKSIVSAPLPLSVAKGCGQGSGGRDPLVDLRKVWNMKLTKSNIFKACTICGSDQNVEMHHVRKIRELRNPKLAKLDFFTRQMAAINRKQIPLCQDHHARLHN